MKTVVRHGAVLFTGLVLAVSATTVTMVPATASSRSASAGHGPPAKGDRAYYVLPPGNYGGFPLTDQSLDQLPLYDGLTPLRGNISDADIAQHFLPENFTPVGPTRVEPTGHPGTTIVYDAYGVAHVTGVTPADLAFGAGWVTARDRSLLLQLGRGPARVAVADVPGIDAFGLITSLQSFAPSAATEQLVTDQVKLIETNYGDKGREIVAEAQAEADGINAYFASKHVELPPFTVNDVIAVTAFIGSIFGAGGGAEASNADFLSRLQNQMGAAEGGKAWDDAMLFDDPDAPTTITQPFPYGIFTGGPVTGSVAIDAGSIISLDPRQPSPKRAAMPLGRSVATNTSGTYPAAGPVPKKEASNFLVVDPSRSADHNPLAVMGPQLGYYYPEIVQQIHLSGPGIEAQGVAVPGAAMYILIGRTANYAWSLTSANHDVRDVFAEVLCNPDGSTPTRESDHYLFDGKCMPFQMFDAGVLNGTTPVRYPTSVHGPLIGTALSHGRPVALTRQRSTFGKDGLNLAALKDMTDGNARNTQDFWSIANEFGFTFNWAYVSRNATAYFSSGLLPRRAPGLDRRLPTLGAGQYEWRGFLSRDEHPHATEGPGGLLLNWNNQSAPGFMHGDDDPYGAVHRVQLFNGFSDDVTLAQDVGIMNRAATEDTRALVWPVVSQVLQGSGAPNALDANVVAVLDDWVRRDAPRLDANNDGLYDDAGPTIMDALWPAVANSVMQPVFGPLTSVLDRIRGLGGLAGESYVDKDLRTLLGLPVKRPFNVRYCGKGSLTECRASLWNAVDHVAATLAATLGADPSAWRSRASRTGFAPGLIPNTMRTTNRPTFQQVLEFDDRRGNLGSGR